MSLRMLADETYQGFLQIVALMNMPEQYAQVACLSSIPLAGLLVGSNRERVFAARASGFSVLCCVLPGALFGGAALTALGYAGYRIYRAIFDCRAQGAAVLWWEGVAPLRCPLQSVFPMFPGIGGLMIYFLLNAALLLWWRREVIGMQLKTCRA